MGEPWPTASSRAGSTPRISWPTTQICARSSTTRPRCTGRPAGPRGGCCSSRVAARSTRTPASTRTTSSSTRYRSDTRSRSEWTSTPSGPFGSEWAVVPAHSGRNRPLDRLHACGPEVDRLADAVIGTAAADVADLIEVGVGQRAALLSDLGDSGHDLARLAVAALRDVHLEPRLLHRVQILADGGRQPLDGGDLVSGGDVPHLHGAGIEGLAFDVRRACPAHLETAAVLGSGDAEQVAQDPEQPDVVLDVDADLLAVQDERVGGHEGSSIGVVK